MFSQASPAWRALGRCRRISSEGRSDVLATMVKRRCAAIGLPLASATIRFAPPVSTIHQENSGHFEDAQQLAGHADMRTTQLYNRKSRNVERREVERVHSFDLPVSHSAERSVARSEAPTYDDQTILKHLAAR